VYVHSVDGYINNLQVTVTFRIQMYDGLIEKRVTIVRMYEAAVACHFSATPRGYKYQSAWFAVRHYLFL